MSNNSHIPTSPHTGATKPRRGDVAILALAIPAIVTNITTPLLGLLDVAITGHMGSALYIAAIAVGGTMFNMLYWLFGFLRMGTSGMTAQQCGRGDMAESAVILLRASAIALVAGIVMIALRGPLCTLILSAIDTDAPTASAAAVYFRILVWGAPAVLFTFVATGWLLGMQNSKAGMWISLAVNVSNIALSLILVYGLEMRIEGVATGTLCAQWIGAAMSAMYCMAQLRRGGATIRELVRGYKPLTTWRGFFGVNIYLVLRTVCMVAVTVWFTRAGAQQGQVMLAVNTLLMQMFLLFSYFMDGFAYAAEALTGKMIGAGDTVELHLTVRRLMGWGIALGAIFSIGYFTCGEWVVRLLTDAREVVYASRDYLGWAVAVPLVGFAAFVWDGVYIGATATLAMMLTVAVSTALYFLLYFALTPSLGNHGLWIAFVSTLAVRSIAQTILWRNRKLVKIS